jgi:hypothetical protein
VHFLIVRQLTQSELGWFGEFRRQGRETSKQRGINFDAAVVERVFPTAQIGNDINLSIRFRGDEGIKIEAHPLKRQAKNWRLVGDKIEDVCFGSVEPGDLFLLTIDAVGETPECAFTIVKPETDLARFVLGCSQTSCLGRSGMIAIHSSESGNLQQHLAHHDPDLFGMKPAPANGTAPDPANDSSAITDADLMQLPDAARMIEIVSNIGHDLNVAVADLIDNSIEAGAQDIAITFPDPNKHGRILAVADNGKGMTPRGLLQAMRFGASRDYNDRDLGKYGIGLKSASLSQARAVVVASRTPEGETEILAWDKKQVTETGNWQLIRPELDSIRDGLLRDPLIDDSGTVVLWEDMIPPRSQVQKRRKMSVDGISAHGLECLQLARHLGKVFHRFIEGTARGKPPLRLTINGNPVEPLDPLVNWHAATIPISTASIRIPGGMAEQEEVVEIHPVVIPHSTEFESEEERDRVGFWGNWQDSQGFYFYRNDRIIQDGGWCGIWINDPHNQLLRVAVDLNSKLDSSFGINVAKMSTQPPALFMTEIESLLREPKAEANSRYRNSKPKKASKRKVKPRATAQPAPNPATASPVGTSSPSASQPTAPTASATAPEAMGIKAIPLGGQGWRCRTDATGNPVTELDSSLQASQALHVAIVDHPAAAQALSSLLNAIDTDDLREKVLSSWAQCDE